MFPHVYPHARPAVRAVGRDSCLSYVVGEADSSPSPSRPPVFRNRGRVRRSLDPIFPVVTPRGITAHTPKTRLRRRVYQGSEPHFASAPESALPIPASPVRMRIPKGIIEKESAPRRPLRSSRRACTSWRQKRRMRRCCPEDKWISSAISLAEAV